MILVTLKNYSLALQCPLPLFKATNGDLIDRSPYQSLDFRMGIFGHDENLFFHSKLYVASRPEVRYRLSQVLNSENAEFSLRKQTCQPFL
jgi:hypothetical protein